MTDDRLDQPHANGRQAESASMPGPDVFAISMRHDQHVGTVALAGELDLNGVDQLAATVDLLLRHKVTVVRIDTTDLSFVDSHGLTVLLEVQAATHAAGAEFHLEGVAGAVERVIDIAGLTELLTPR
jgi:anti-anti-sigma factor